MDEFLEFNGSKWRIVSAKSVSEQAKLHAETEFEDHKIMKDRLYKNDFDRFLVLMTAEADNEFGALS